MSTYPQLGTGALSQYPTVKRRSQRTVWNAMADGGAIKLADPAAAVTTWRLAYTDLTDDEGAALETFFGEMEGSLRGFTFLDPGGNLLAWSGKLDEGIWQKDPALTLSGGVSDPTGGTSAWRAVNAGAAPQSLVQAIEAPGEYVYCLSVYLRATEPAPVIMRLGELRGVRAAGVGWRRAVLAGNAGAGGDGVRFGIEIPPARGWKCLDCKRSRKQRHRRIRRAYEAACSRARDFATMGWQSLRPGPTGTPAL